MCALVWGWAWMRGSVQEPLPLGWKVYVSRSTGKPYWHHKDSNETRWTRPGIGPAAAQPPPSADENAPPTQKGLLKSLDDKIQSRMTEAVPAEESKEDREQRLKREAAEQERREEEERKKEAERREREDADRKKEEEAKRKEAFRKKAEEQKNELDLSSLVQAAASKEQEAKESEAAAKQQRMQDQKSRLLSLSKSASTAAEKEQQQAKEGRWWEQVDQDARDIATGSTQPGANAAAFPVLSKMGSVTASRAGSVASSRAPSAMAPAGSGGGTPGTPLGAPCSMEVCGAGVATPDELGLGGIRSPVHGTWDGSGGAKFHEEAGDLATAEKMYLSAGDKGVAMAADMYVRHKRIAEAVRVTRAAASGDLEAEGLVFELLQKAVKAEHNTERAAALMEEYCGAQHAVQVALERGVFAVALGVATRNRSAMHMIPEIRFAHGDAMCRAGKFEEACDLFVRSKRHLAAAQLHGLLGQWDKAAAVAGRHKGGEAKAWVEASRSNASVPCAGLALRAA